MSALSNPCGLDAATLALLDGQPSEAHRMDDATVERMVAEREAKLAAVRDREAAQAAILARLKAEEKAKRLASLARMLDGKGDEEGAERVRTKARENLEASRAPMAA